MNDIRLLALDIDGTILTREKKLTARTKNAIESAADAGIAIALVTGRPFHGIPDELMFLKGLGYVISSNGAVTTDAGYVPSDRKSGSRACHRDYWHA